MCKRKICATSSVHNLVHEDAASGTDRAVEIIGLTIGRHGYRHNRAGRQIKGAPDGIDRGEDTACLRSGRCGDVIRWHPLVRGAQLIDMSQCQNNTRRPASKLRRPDAKVIEALTVGTARRLRCGGDPQAGAPSRSRASWSSSSGSASRPE